MLRRPHFREYSDLTHGASLPLWRITLAGSTRIKKAPGEIKQTTVKARSPSHKKILVVEDHPDARELLVIQLRRMTCEVIEATTGEEGIEKAVAEDPNLVIMDLGLPGISGIEATVRLKQNPRTAHIPVVALTVWNEQVYKRKALEAGMAEYLTKPTPTQVLKSIIERFLKTKE